MIKKKTQVTHIFSLSFIFCSMLNIVKIIYHILLHFYLLLLYFFVSSINLKMRKGRYLCCWFHFIFYFLIIIFSTTEQFWHNFRPFCILKSLLIISKAYKSPHKIFYISGKVSKCAFIFFRGSISLLHLISLHVN